MSKDIVVITKKESTNGVYHPYGPVSVGFKIKADKVSITEIGNLVAENNDDYLSTSYVQKVKVNKKKFSAKVHTLNSIYKLKFKAKENSELFKKFMWDLSHIDSCTKLSKDKGTDVGKTTMSMIDCVEVTRVAPFL